MLHLTPNVVTTLGIYTHLWVMLIGLRLSVDIFRRNGKIYLVSKQATGMRRLLRPPYQHHLLGHLQKG